MRRSKNGRKWAPDQGENWQDFAATLMPILESRASKDKIERFAQHVCATWGTVVWNLRDRHGWVDAYQEWASN